jgi:hypothetical protein
MINYTDEQFNQCVYIWNTSESAISGAHDMLQVLGLDASQVTGNEWCDFIRKVVSAAANTTSIDVPEAHQSTLAAPREAQGTHDPLASGFDLTNPPPNVRRFAELCIAMTQTYDRKNTDYGDSFSRSVQRYGKIAALTRMSDKWNRLENLMLSNDSKVKDESVTDTLIDLASYALMTVMELEK